MKRTTLKTCVYLGLSSFLLTTNAMAYSQSDSSALAEWDTFAVNAASGMTLNFNINNDSGSYRGSNSQAGSLFGWETVWSDFSNGNEYDSSSATEHVDTLALSPSSLSHIDASAGAQTTNTNIYSWSSSAGDNGGYFSAASIAQRWGSFYVEAGSGTIDLSYDYLLSTEGTSTNGLSYGLAQTWATLVTYDLDNGWVTQPTVSDYVDLYLDTASGSETSGVKTMTISGDFSAGMYGIYTISTKSVTSVADEASPVPIPQAAWLLGTGLIGLLGLRRRTQQS